MNTSVIEIKKLVSLNRIKEAIALLDQFSASKNNSFKKQVLEISAKFNRWQEKEILNLGSNQDLIEIRISIIELLDSEGDVLRLVIPEQDKKSKWKILGVVVCGILTLIITGAVLWNIDLIFPSETNYSVTEISNPSIKNKPQNIGDIKIDYHIKKKIDDDELRFSISGTGLTKKESTVGKYRHKEIDDSWAEEWSEPEIIYYDDDSAEWNYHFWHELKPLRNGEQFEFGLFENSSSRTPFFSFDFKVRHIEKL